MRRSEFEREFSRLYVPLGMYALRMVGDTDVSEDIVQDAFMKVWVYMEDGGDVRNITAFMYRAVRNACVSYLRGLRDTVSPDDIPEMADEDSDVGRDEIDTSFRDARIWQAIDALPERCRQVFLLSKRDGLTNDEIARELGISIKTVKNQMTKAFARLRDALDTRHRPFFLPFL